MESARRATAAAIEIGSSPAIPCKHCNMKFSSVQALGGHQNAHRVDREVAKRLRHAEFTGRPKNVPEPQAVECCTEEGPVGLCLWCMKSAPLKLCVNRPSASEIAGMMQKSRNVGQRPQQSAAAVKRCRASINVAGTGTGTGSAAVAARKYYGVENDEPRAAAVVPGSSRRMVGDLDLTLRL